MKVIIIHFVGIPMLNTLIMSNAEVALASGPGETQGSRIGSVLHWGQGTEEQQQDTEQMSKDSERYVFLTMQLFIYF